MENFTQFSNTPLMIFISQISTQLSIRHTSKIRQMTLSFLVILFCSGININTINAQPIQQRGNSSNQAGIASSVATVVLSNKTITALRTTGGNLKLISWSRPGSGSILRLGDSGTQTGKIGYSISMVKVGNNKVATLIEIPGAHAGSDNKKKIILWLVQDNGTITRLADSGDKMGYGIPVPMDMFYMGGVNKIVTAHKSAKSRIRLISWRISGTGHLIRLKTYEGKRGWMPKLTRLNQSNFGDALVLAYSSGLSSIALSTFRLASNGEFTLIHEINVRKVASGIELSQHSNKLAVALRTDDTKRLKIVIWAMNSAGHLIRKGSASAGAINDLSICKSKNLGRGDFIITTAVIDSNNKMKLINWKIGNKGSSVSRLGSSTPIEMNLLKINIVGNNILSTAIIDSHNKLKIYNWTY